MNIERIKPIIRPGWDCLYGSHCEFAGLYPNNHGIHGDEFYFGVRTELPDGRIVAVSLAVFTSRFPSTVPASHFGDGLGLSHYPNGADLTLHVQRPRGVSQAHPRTECEFLGNGRFCEVRASSGLQAHKLYAEFGLTSCAPDVEFEAQPIALYDALTRWMMSRLGS